MKIKITVEVDTNLPEEVIENLQNSISYEFENFFNELDENETKHNLDKEDCESTVSSVTVTRSNS